MQDEIVSRLACTLGYQLAIAEARRAERSPHPDAMDLIFQAKACLWLGNNPQNFIKARDLYERALPIDDRNVGALVSTAFLDLMRGTTLLTDEPTAFFSAAETNLIKALSLAPDDSNAHCILGCVYILTNRAIQGIAECEHALRLNRNLAAAAHGTIGAGNIVWVNLRRRNAM
jgi:tetratricopeptide (TPR) repeat protein